MAYTCPACGTTVADGMGHVCSAPNPFPTAPPTPFPTAPPTTAPGPNFIPTWQPMPDPVRFFSSNAAWSGFFTEQDRQMLREVHQMLSELRRRMVRLAMPDPAKVCPECFGHGVPNGCIECGHLPAGVGG